MILDSQSQTVQKGVAAVAPTSVYVVNREGNTLANRPIV